MTQRERLLAAVKRRPVDRIPTTFRCHKVLARDLRCHFRVLEAADSGPGEPSRDAAGDLLAVRYRDLLRCLGADL